MKLTVLGCCGVYAAAGEACSGYLVQGGGVNVLMDAGAGTLGALQRHLPLEDLDAVLVSHSHPDHWVEVPVLRNAFRYVLHREGVPLFAPAEVLDLVARVSHEHVRPTLEPQLITGGDEFRLGELTVRCSRTDHPPETLAFCLDDGRNRIAYSADTGPRWGFEAFGEPVDLALCEATFREGDRNPEAVHLTAAQAGTAAARASARSLVITHMLPGADAEGARLEAESAYGSAVGVARSGLVVEL